jgi:hypothetical protein
MIIDTNMGTRRIGGGTLAVFAVCLLLVVSSVPSGAINTHVSSKSISETTSRNVENVTAESEETAVANNTAVGNNSTTALVSSDEEVYRYRVPFSITTAKLSGGYNSNLKVWARTNGTQVRVDSDADGTFETTRTISVGENIYVSDPENGTVVETDAPVRTRYKYKSADFGAYEDGRLTYGLLSARQAGQEYYTPIDAASLQIAGSDGTTVRIDRDGDGTTDTTRTIEDGNVLTVADPARGAHIESTAPIHVVAQRTRWDNMDYTYAVSLLPVGAAEANYAVSGELDYNADNPTSKSGAYVVALRDGTSVQLDIGNDGLDEEVMLDTGETHKFNFTQTGALNASAPIVPVYTYHVRAGDWWNPTRRDFIGANIPVDNQYMNQGEWGGQHWDGGIHGWTAYTYEGTTASEPPAAIDIASDPTVPTTGRSVQLYANAFGNLSDIERWQWDFGDSATAEGQLVAHTYDTSGTYTVELTAYTEAGEQQTVEKELTVEAGLPPGYNVAVDPVLYGTTVDSVVVPEGIPINLSYQARVSQPDRTQSVTFEFGNRTYTDNDGSDGWTFDAPVTEIHSDVDLSVTARRTDGTRAVTGETLSVIQSPAWFRQMSLAGTESRKPIVVLEKTFSSGSDGTSFSVPNQFPFGEIKMPAVGGEQSSTVWISPTGHVPRKKNCPICTRISTRWFRLPSENSEHSFR